MAETLLITNFPDPIVLRSWFPVQEEREVVHYVNVQSGLGSVDFRNNCIQVPCTTLVVQLFRRCLNSSIENDEVSIFSLRQCRLQRPLHTYLSSAVFPCCRQHARRWLSSSGCCSATPNRLWRSAWDPVRGIHNSLSECRAPFSQKM